MTAAATVEQAKTTSVTPIDCTVCSGEGIERYNATQDPITGVWDCDERTCGPCAGTGQLPALANYETSVLPSTGQTQWRCLHCECHVNPTQHLPGSEDCRSAAEERAYSRADDDDPWGES